MTYLELIGKSKADPKTEVKLIEITRDDANIRKIITEFEETITVKKRSRKDISFKTGFRKEATLSDILDAGLVTESQAKDLETGIITEKDLSSQLEKYLFCGEIPISGIIVEKTGQKLSINDAVKQGIIKRGTAIELLEAQAATGSIIDPINNKKLSVEEAAKCGKCH